MKIIGGMQTKGCGWNLDDFERLFARLRTEVKHGGGLTRYVGYTSECNDVRFLGAEVESVEDVPEGMVAWELTAGSWTVTQTVGGKASVIWEAFPVWWWLDQPDSGFMTGEFTAECPVDWLSRETSDKIRMYPTANAYVDMSVEGSDDGVYLADYDPDWPRQFEEIARWIREELGTDLALRVEHYGSTSIPGLIAKPVIDVLVEVSSFEKARECLIPLFNQPEWEYWSYSDHMIFIRRDGLMGRRTHHVHVAPAGHEIWKGLAFRDYLRAHPEEAARYAALKEQLAAQYQADRERYTEAKTSYIQEVTARALAICADVRI